MFVVLVSVENSDEHIRISLQNAVYHEVPIDLFFCEISKKDFLRVFPTGTHLNSRAIVFTFYIDSTKCKKGLVYLNMKISDSKIGLG